MVVSVGANTGTDGGGNTGPAAAESETAVWDATAPTVAITGVPSAINSTSNLNVTFTWSEDVTGFVTGDVTVSGGTKGAFAGSGKDYTLVVTPAGNADVVVTVAQDAATDGANTGPAAAASATATWDTNNAPMVANAIPDQPATAGSQFSYAFPIDTFSDADGDMLTYTATKSDGTALSTTWLTFTASTRTFSGTPQSANVGTLSVKVTAADASASVSDTFDITVSESVTGPTVTIEGGPAVTEGTAATFTVTASPAPSATLTVNLTVSETSGSDFVASTNEGATTVEIASGTTTATLTVATVADSVNEPRGAVTAQLATGSGYNVGTASSARVTVHDDDGPGISSVAFTNLPSVSTWGIGGVIELTATFSEAVTVTGAPRFALTPAFGAAGTATRHASYVSGDGSTALVFRYTVAEGDNSLGAANTSIRVVANALALNGGAILAGSADADLAHDSASSGKGVYAVRGTISSASAFPSPGVDADLDGTAETFTMTTGNNEIKVWVGFASLAGNDPVVVDTKGSNGNVQVVADIGGTEVALDYISTNRTDIEFGTHTVVAANADSDGIVLKRDASDKVIRLRNGATVKGSEVNGGNDANLTASADVGVRAVTTKATPLVRVRGTNAPPTGTDFSRSTASGADLSFAKADFGIADADGDPLKEIWIVTLPPVSVGALELDGTAIAGADLPKTVTHTELDEGKLKFESAAGFAGETRFTFKVVDSHDGAAVSANTATIRALPATDLVRFVSYRSLDDNGDGRFDTYIRGDEILVDVEFSEPVVVAGDYANVQLRLDLDGSTKVASLKSELYGGRTLRFAYVVKAADTDTDGVWVKTNASNQVVFLTGTPKATIVGADTGSAAVLTKSGLPRAGDPLHKVNGSVTSIPGPRPSGATVNDGTLTVTFDKSLDASVDTAQLAMNLAVEGAGDVSGGHRNAFQHPTWIAISGRTLTLTLSTPARAGQTVTLTYTGGGLLKGTDSARSPVPAFRVLDLTNSTIGGAGPAPWRADVSGKKLRVVFDGTLDTNSLPPGGAFQVRTSDRDDDDRDLWGEGTASVDGSVVEITLKEAVHSDEMANVSYHSDRAGASPLRAEGGGAAVLSFDRFRIEQVNDVIGPVPRDMSIVAISGGKSKVVIYFDETLDTSSLPAPGDFSVVGFTTTIEDIVIADNSVVLTANPEITGTQENTVNHVPGTNRIRDVFGNAVDASFSRVATVDTGGAPAFGSANVDGARLTVTLTKAADPASQPAARAFTLHHPLLSGETDADLLAYQGTSVTGVRLRAEKVQLRLEHPVYPCASAFTLTYKPADSSASPLQGLDGTDAGGFAKQAVTNDRASRCVRGGGSIRQMQPTGSVQSKSVTLNFGRTLDTGKTLSAADFAVEASESALSVAGASFTADGTGLTLVLRRALAAGETATVGYEWPRSGQGLWDTAGNQIDSFSGVRVTNGAAVSTAPAFDDGDKRTLSIEENHADGATVGTVAARDGDGDVLAYSLAGEDAAHFEIGEDGTIAVKSGTILNYEARASYTFTAAVTDGEDADGNAEAPPVEDDAIEVTVDITNVEEPPGAPTGVAAVAAGTDGLSVSWTAPADTGALAVATHDLRWFAGDDDPAAASAWTEVSDTGAGTEATLSGLSPDTAYRVQARAVGDGAGPWSASASGRTEAPTPLTAAFEGLPATHDGARRFGFEIVFSEEFDGLRLTAFAAGALEIAGGRLIDAKRVTRGENRRVAVRVRPDSDEAMTLTLKAPADCAAADAVCAADGRKLSAAVAATVAGPATAALPALSVADATAAEGDTLSFAVALDAASDADVAVDWATADGTATAGSDYTAGSGTLTFSAGETSKTVSVATLADRVSDDGETVTLTLSNPSGATLGDAEATGTTRRADVAAALPALAVAARPRRRAGR